MKLNWDRRWNSIVNQQSPTITSESKLFIHFFFFVSFWLGKEYIGFVLCYEDTRFYTYQPPQYMYSEREKERERKRKEAERNEEKADEVLPRKNMLNKVVTRKRPSMSDHLVRTIRYHRSRFIGHPALGRDVSGDMIIGTEPRPAFFKEVFISRRVRKTREFLKFISGIPEII